MTRLWCNTVLVAFSAMQKIVKDYDFAFKSRLQSSFMSVHLKNGIPTQTLVKEMLEINRRKLRLLILRDTVNTALGALPPSEKDILVRRFLKGETFQEIALRQDISIRTAFRRFDKAREDFCHALEAVGFTEKHFRETYLSDPAVKAACSRLDDETYFTAKSTAGK